MEFCEKFFLVHPNGSGSGLSRSSDMRKTYLVSRGYNRIDTNAIKQFKYVGKLQRREV